MALLVSDIHIKTVQKQISSHERCNAILLQILPIVVKVCNADSIETEFIYQNFKEYERGIVHS